MADVFHDLGAGTSNRGVFTVWKFIKLCISDPYVFLHVCAAGIKVSKMMPGEVLR